MSAPHKLVILDRDGVINHDSESYIRSADEWQPINGSLNAIAQLNQAGYRVVVATNQSGVGRGLFSMSTLNQIHTKMHCEAEAVGAHIDAIFCCTHAPKDVCGCRKPKPGLLEMIVKRFGIDPAITPVVGDARRDLEAGAALHFPVHLVLTGKGRAALDAYQNADALPGHAQVHGNLAAFVSDFLFQPSIDETYA
ncbi:D,D-heptose 1,7-bisphosphate phosphatase [Candidatus Glomeribacter gigasporarum BEG34]|uniref:D,D-heptose 1,7-bisphosphate phosphatase n=1 Tax=Candidatus Glomeribacter gigasporarum BEG34 TaxID=1070319 RepID=G2JBX5_9BURK|nr:D-glycero-beta-D-manno-heptose 1,7-bisphosphate 7-phosphatase [Candidatus Glomeribacter gigasporarum]CCD30281.1 D,D-heptose 1,7-bisphosphate phosphatase [Candidatus Glomeribacter gigasporarum BEG34]